MQCNVQGTDPQHVIARHMSAVAHPTGDLRNYRPDVIVWNELTHAPAQRFLHSLSGLHSYQPGDYGSAAGAVAISWRPDVFKLVDSHSTPVVKGIAHVTPTRVINAVILQHRDTGRKVAIVGTHVVHHIETGGRVRLVHRITGQAARAKTQFLKLASTTKRIASDYPLRGSGDLNVSWQAEKHLKPSRRVPWFPLTTLGKVAHIVPFSHGTHGGRGIDWVWTAGPITTVHEHVLPRGTSDHNPRWTVHEI